MAHDRQARARCRRCRDRGPGRRGRSARRCGRCSAPGCRCPGRPPSARRSRPRTLARICTATSVTRSTSRRSRPGCRAPRPAGGDRRRPRPSLRPSSTAISMPARLGQLAGALDGFGDDVARSATASAQRLLAELDPRQLEQVVDRAGDPDAPRATIRSATRWTTSGSSSSASVSASTASAPTGRLQLVADVGHEVGAHGVEPASLADVLDRRHRRRRRGAARRRRRRRAAAARTARASGGDSLPAERAAQRVLRRRRRASSPTWVPDQRWPPAVLR